MGVTIDRLLLTVFEKASVHTNASFVVLLKTETELMCWRFPPTVCHFP